MKIVPFASLVLATRGPDVLLDMERRRRALGMLSLHLDPIPNPNCEARRRHGHTVEPLQPRDHPGAR